MPKALPKVEQANSLDDEAYQYQFVPDLAAGALPGVTLEFASSAELVRRERQHGKDNSELESCFQILKTTSFDDYKASGHGWKDGEKRTEMRLPDMRYVLVHDEQKNEVQGFISFMMTYEDGFEVLYVYEVHLSETLRGKGIGWRLMKIVEEIGTQAHLSKIMLTNYTRNEAAFRFYRRLGFNIDDFSPEPRKLRNGVVKQPDYRILSRTLEYRKV